MSHALSRRQLLETAAALGAVALAGCATTRRARLVEGRLRHACIGVGGMGASDMERIASHPSVDLVALCDVDAGRLEAAAAKAPGARLYRDWRELLAVEPGAIDSVNVTTPDHMHAPIAMEALRAGLHVYCQKPLTRTVHEARALAEAARRSGAVTQMGIQNHSHAPYAQARELFRGGHVGRVHAVHVWTDRPAGWWAQGVERDDAADPVPEALDWDLWLGVAPERPYVEGAYHAFAWRGRRDFGTGAQGDMGCHLMDPALWFLELGAPLRLRSDGPAPNDESFPLWSRVHYEFPATRHTTRGPLLLTWHDGGRRPAGELFDELGVEEVPANACLFLGEDGALMADPYGPPRLLPAERFAHVAVPERTDGDHWHQWVEACRGVGAPSAGFDYAARLTEVALLGNAALGFPHETLEWDAAGLRFPNRPEADAHLFERYREGWAVRGLSPRSRA